MKSRKFHIIWITARNTAMNDSDVNSLVIRGQKLDSADIFSMQKMYMSNLEKVDVYEGSEITRKTPLFFSFMKKGIRLE